MDETLENVSTLHKSESSVTMATQTTEESSSDDGMPDTSSSSSSSSSSGENGSCFCPYRDYIRLAKLAPPGTISICSLHKILRPLGCSKIEINACFFALDTENVGHVKMGVFRSNAVDVIVEFTQLDRDTAQRVVSNLPDKM